MLRQEALDPIEDFVHEEQRPGEYEKGPDPVTGGEVVVEVDQGDDQRCKLSEGHHEGNSQGGVLGDHVEDGPAADVPASGGSDER